MIICISKKFYICRRKSLYMFKLYLSIGGRGRKFEKKYGLI